MLIGCAFAAAPAFGQETEDPFASGAAAPPSRVRGVGQLQEPGSPHPPIGADNAPPATFTSPASAAGPDNGPPADYAAPVTPTDDGLPAVDPSTSAFPAVLIEGGEIIARVDGQVILASDLLWQADQLIKRNGQQVPPAELQRVRRMLLQKLMVGLIDTKLLYADFRRKVPAEALPKIEETIAKPFEEIEVPRLMKMMNASDRRAMEAELKRSGASLKDVQRQFTEKTIAGEWIKERSPKPRPATHEEMLAHYREHMAEYEYPAQVRWEELMVRFDRFNGDRQAAWTALAQMGNDVWKKAQSQPGITGPVFAEIAKQKSHGFTAAKGGVHDWTTMGALKCEAINQALATLQLGQLSDGIESELGFHIVRVLERKEAGRTPFTEAQAKIRQNIEAQQKQALIEAELVKLRKTASVWTIFDGEVSGERLCELIDGTLQR